MGAIQRGEIPSLRFRGRALVPVPAVILQLVGVSDVPAFLHDPGVADLPALVRFMTSEGGPRFLGLGRGYG